MIDLAAVKLIGELIGLAGAAFAGGMLGQTKVIKTLQAGLNELRLDVADIKHRLGIPNEPRPKNGPASTVDKAELGLAEDVITLEAERRSRRRNG